MAHKLFFLVLLLSIGLFAYGATKPNSASFNVRIFGAVGNGTTKDTAAFQNALFQGEATSSFLPANILLAAFRLAIAPSCASKRTAS